jgi:hypothetical protein
LMVSIVFSTRARSSALLSMVHSTDSLASLAHFAFRRAWYLEGMSPRIHSVGRISFDYSKTASIGRFLRLHLLQRSFARFRAYFV